VQLVESESVAANTVKTLGLPQSVSSFRAAYTATSTTSQIITITLHAPTAGASDQAAGPADDGDRSTAHDRADRDRPGDGGEVHHKQHDRRHPGARRGYRGAPLEDQGHHRVRPVRPDRRARDRPWVRGRPRAHLRPSPPA